MAPKDSERQGDSHEHDSSKPTASEVINSNHNEDVKCSLLLFPSLSFTPTFVLFLRPVAPLFPYCNRRTFFAFTLRSLTFAQ